NVEVYSTPTCGYCQQAKRFLSERGIKFTEYDVSRDRAAADKMVRLTGHMGVPVIVVDGEVVIGFDRPRLERLLAGRGNAGHPRFGLKVADASKVAQKFGAVPVFGALVGAVATSSLGERAGIRKGDIITEINLRPIHNADNLEQALASLTPGGRATIVFLRGQETLRSEVTIEEPREAPFL
ncbi:MAG: Uxx-star family glutaredoxin-like (seleno)protein, partial [Dehalococcoidia bacterium]